MKKEKASSWLVQDILTQGDSLFSQLAAEAEAVEVTGTVDSDVRIRRNELLLKIDDQIAEIDRTLGRVEVLNRQLKKHRGKLQQLRKIMSK